MKTKANDASTQQKKRPEASTKQKTKREEASVIRVDTLFWHNFEHNTICGGSSIMPA